MAGRNFLFVRGPTIVPERVQRAMVVSMEDHRIAVANIRNDAVHMVPEYAFALILALRCNLLAYRQDVEAGVWQKSEQV